jgi:spermidine synthase
MSSVSTSGSDASSRRGYVFEILLISFVGLLLEVGYTRIISFKLFYYYTYLVIGLALLGIGTGGVLVAISAHLRRAKTDTIMMWGLLLGAVSVGIGYAVVALTSTDTFAIWDYGTLTSFANVARLLVISVALFASFIAIGVMIATLFSRRPERIGRLYFADLFGAGLACAVVVALLASIGPPATIMLSGLILAVAGLRIALRRKSRVVPVAAGLAVVLGIGAVWPSVLPRQRPDALKQDIDEDKEPYFSWSPIFRVDVAEVSPDARLLFHDGLFGSVIYRWKGDVSTLGRYDTDARRFPFAVKDAPPRRVLIIGAAGGNEVLTSLYYKAGHIDAIELNPVTYDLVTNRFADYDGHLADRPNVNYEQGDGRTFLARSNDTYDIVWFPAPDSYATTTAAQSGAFVLSESYLYTSETIVDSFDHLGPNGVIATQYGEFDYEGRPNRTTRYVATARHALAERGIKNPSRHIIVVTTPTEGPSALSTILVKEKPFTPAEVDRLVSSIPAVPRSTLRYAPGHPVEGSSVSELATIPGSRLEGWYDSYPYDVRPISDDAPFFWHFSPFGDVVRDITHSVQPDDVAVGERVLLLLLVVAAIFAAVFLLLPFLSIRKVWTAFPRKPRSALYFAALGLGFMFFEITLIQRLVLFLGYPTYSLTVTLASILIFTGVGALLTGRYGHRPGRVVPFLLAALAALTIFYQFGLPPLTDALLGWPLAARVVTAFVMLAPLGICLGAFMPLGLGAVSRLTEFSRQYVAWGWAVNGFASVVGAVLTTILAMTFGFRIVLFLALAMYVVAVLALRGLLRDTRDVSPVPSEVMVPVEPEEKAVPTPSPAPS